MRQLFPDIPIIRFEPDSRKCDCGGTRRVLKTKNRTFATLAIGQMRAHTTVTLCEGCGRIAHPEKLEQIVPQYGQFGFDVIVYVGTEMFIRCRTDLEIKHQLADKNIPISIREIGYLGARFVTYLAILHKDARKDLKNLLDSNGGYILHLDGTCEGNSPHLMTALDEMSEVVLGNIKLPSENAAMIIPFLKDLKKSYGQPIAMVHDMGSGILDAIRKVFPKIPDFICHFHFLRDIGKDLFDHEHTMLRNGFKKHRTRTHLRSAEKKFRQKIQADYQLSQALESIQTPSTGMEQINSGHLSPIVRAYLLVLWILDFAADLNGIGFPFDRAQLAFYQRIETAWDMIEASPKGMSDDVILLKQAISPIIRNGDMKRIAERLREKAALFDDLRLAMRIALPDTTRGLNDDGTDCDMITIKKKVCKFRKTLANLIAAKAYPDSAYIKMLKQIDKYWNKLFADPITVKTANGEVTIQPQRTNNILERFFRDLKRRWRKKTGSAHMSKALRTMLADTPLVRNLQNPSYMEAILSGAPDLQTRFAQIDSGRVRQKLLEETRSPERVPASLKRVLRTPGQILKLFQKTIMRGALKTKSNQVLPS